MTQALGRVVVVGAGLGGFRSVECLRRRGYLGEIILLGEERHLPYDRPPLSKEVLRGEPVRSLVRTLDDLKALDVDLRLDAPVDSLFVDAQAVGTSKGLLTYDAVILATGAAPKRLAHVGGRVLRTLDEALALRSALRADSRLVVIGAGLVGCEVAATARGLGVEVALVDVLPAPAFRVLGHRVGQLLTDLHEAHGVELHLDAHVLASEGGRVALDGGTVLNADIVLEAIGVIPNTGWLIHSGLALDDGVMCDSEGRAAPNVYAVGDVANWAGKRHEHWTNAGLQADHVAALILGQETPLPAVSYWWSDQYKVKLQSLGSPSPNDDVEMVAWGPQSRTVAVYSSSGRLTGLVGFSAPGAIMRLRDDVGAGTAVADILDRLAAR